MLIKNLYKIFFFLIIGLIFLWLGGFFWFTLKIQNEKIESINLQTDAIIVFTGSPGRILEGIKLIDSESAPYMYVTGVNLSSLKSTQQWIENKTSKYTCCIELDTAAKNTVGNAKETAKWINEKKTIKSIRLVTASYHILRSYIELKRYIAADIIIIKHPVNDARYPKGKYYRKFSSVLFLSYEYTKYLVSLIRYRIEK